uniref:Uncharacterized protein n=1 Tax=Panagrolaimus superbus TaxID=310955 RepID=A0A914Z0Y0_9BILA
MSNSIWSENLSLSSSSSNETTASNVSSSSSSSYSSFSSGTPSYYLNSGLHVPENVNAETINKAFKDATESVMHTLKLSHAAEAHYNDLNLKLAEKVSDQFTKIEVAKTILESRLSAIQCNNSTLNPQILEGLLNRHKIVKDKLILRQEALSQMLDKANEYRAKSYIGEISDTIEETHNRFLMLKKDINGSTEIEDKLEMIANLLEKFCSLSFYGISAAAASETYEASLEKIEREEIFNDALRQIYHVSECIKKAKEEPCDLLTIDGTSSSKSMNSLNDFLVTVYLI